jgi:hypothetical protein
MKEKIKAALQQGHKNLGITDEEVFERAASAVETFITDEAQIPEFVEKAGPMLKLYQSEADKARTANKRASELEAKLKDTHPQPEPPKDNHLPDAEAISKLVQDALAANNEANKKMIDELQNKIANFETAQSSKEAIDKAHAKYESDEYVKGYPEEAQESWERALEINQERGNKMTADELFEKAKGYFDKAVAKRGVDVSKPYDSNGNNNDNFDADKYRKSLERTGRVKTKDK